MNFLRKKIIQFHVKTPLSRRRIKKIDGLLNGWFFNSDQEKKIILDIGCNSGKDLVTFLKDREDLLIIGIDLQDYELRQSNFHMVIGDANCLPFKNGVFDISVSIGVFEHIVPIEKLAQAVREIRRVSLSFVAVMPSISTIIEPHIGRFLWQLLDQNKKAKYNGTLLHMSDEAWMSFEGFKDANSSRYSHLPLFINNIIIYKNLG